MTRDNCRLRIEDKSTDTDYTKALDLDLYDDLLNTPISCTSQLQDTVNEYKRCCDDDSNYAE